MISEEQYYINAHQQSRIFMCEIFPTIYRLIKREAHVSILDVGAATGAGTALLRDLLHPRGFLYAKATVIAMDIEPTFQQHAIDNFELSYLVADIATLHTNQFDVIVSSHTIEHVEDPYLFLTHLKRVATKNVVITCPYKEIDRINGHVNTIDDTFINATDPKEVHIFQSAGWGLPCVGLVY